MAANSPNEKNILYLYFYPKPFAIKGRGYRYQKFHDKLVLNIDSPDSPMSCDVLSVVMFIFSSKQSAQDEAQAEVVLPLGETLKSFDKSLFTSSNLDSCRVFCNKVFYVKESPF